MGAVTKEQARSMGADRASEDKAPVEPSDLADWPDEHKIAYYEGFAGAAEDWSEDLLDRSCLADEYADRIRKEARIERVQ